MKKTITNLFLFSPALNGFDSSLGSTIETSSLWHVENYVHGSQFGIKLVESLVQSMSRI